MSRIKIAEERFLNGFNCAQAIFTTYSEELGLTKEVASKIACAFGGGLASSGYVCGAVSGALMIIGLKYASPDAKEKESRKIVYAKAREFIKKFIERNGSIICKELLNCDISTPEGRKFAEEKKLFKKVCPKFIKDAAQILEELLK